MEGLIHEEVNLFKSFIDQQRSEPFDFMNKLNLPILNALWKVTVGERFSYDNPRLLSIVERLTEAFKIFGNPSQALLLAYPWLAKIIPSFFDIDHTDKVLKDVIDLMYEMILKHKETLDPNEPRDFTDMMLTEIEKTTDETSSMFGQLGLDNLKVTLFDLFLAGSETTSTTLTWSFLYMVRYPEIQRKVQKELDEVVGMARMPSMKDKPDLPYTEVNWSIRSLTGLTTYFAGRHHGDTKTRQHCAHGRGAHQVSPHPLIGHSLAIDFQRERYRGQRSRDPGKHHDLPRHDRDTEGRPLGRWEDLPPREIPGRAWEDQERRALHSLLYWETSVSGRNTGQDGVLSFLHRTCSAVHILTRERWGLSNGRKHLWNNFTTKAF